MKCYLNSSRGAEPPATGLRFRNVVMNHRHAERQCRLRRRPLLDMRSIHPTTRRVSTVHEVLASHLVGGAGIVAIRLARAARERQIPSMSWVPGRGPASDSLDREGVSWRT